MFLTELDELSNHFIIFYQFICDFDINNSEYNNYW
jgi:hypothetical protein